MQLQHSPKIVQIPAIAKNYNKQMIGRQYMPLELWQVGCYLDVGVGVKEFFAKFESP